MSADARRLALALHAAAVRSANADAATAAALTGSPLPDGRLWLLAAGKAATAMTAAAVRTLADAGRTITDGLVVGTAADTPPHPALTAVAGDHPTPGARSLAAAERLATLVTHVEPGDVLLVLLSGGASSLLAAPVSGISQEDMQSLHERLLRSGADIETMNRLRKRVSRWGAGRVAAAVAPAAVRCLAVSDVAGDDPAIIGSGPCDPDPATAAELLDLVARERLDVWIPQGIRRHLMDVAAGRWPETPKPCDAAFARASTRIVLANADALHGAAAAGTALTLDVEDMREELRGPAADAGRRCAERLLAARARRGAGGAPIALLWGGETTVTLPAGAPPGGRCQELALAAAVVLHAAGDAAAGIALLAAGTDGRDGPTDAAGAIVDGGTWARIAAAGMHPDSALRAHDSHAALDAAGDLLRTGPTGTNVRDVVVGIAAE